MPVCYAPVFQEIQHNLYAGLVSFAVVEVLQGKRGEHLRLTYGSSSCRCALCQVSRDGAEIRCGLTCQQYPNFYWSQRW